MTDEDTRELWDSRIQGTATYIQSQTGAGAVLVAIFNAPWQSGAQPAVMGMAGRPDVDMFQLARDLRDLATIVEKQAGVITSGEPFAHEGPRTPPVRHD